MPGADGDRLLDFVAEIHGHLDLGELRVGLLEALMRLVRSDWASLNEVGRSGEDVVYVTLPEPPEALHAPFARWFAQNPLIQHYQRTQDGRPYRFSDVVGVEELHALELYREVYAPMGAEHQVAFVVQLRADAFLGVALSRRAPDYSDAERDVLERVRPSIIQAYNNAQAAERVLGEPVSRAGTRERIAVALRGAGLSAREADVVSLLAVGHSAATQAAELGISARTVNKHLENGYRKLGVDGRVGAIARAWALAEAS